MGAIAAIASSTVEYVCWPAAAAKRVSAQRVADLADVVRDDHGRADGVASLTRPV